MICAKTNMQRLPETCYSCDKYFAFGQGGHCEYLGMFEGDVKDGFARLPACPLVEIDETLPAQLAAAEARCAKLGRLLDANDS